MQDNKDKIILDLCGGTGAWSKPYADNGYTVINVTLPDYDVRTYQSPENVYGILAAPPCTMFSFARTHPKNPRDLREGMELVVACLNIIWESQTKLSSDQQRKPTLKFWCLENPKGMLEWFLGKPAFIFHPIDFGENYTKKTFLWGYFNNPHKFYQMNFDEPIRTISDIVWKNTKTRKDVRSITPPGFTRAFYESNK